MQEFEYVVIDGPGSLAEVTRAIVLLADIAIIPCQPTGLDLESASDTVRLISQARLIRKGMPHSVAFLSRAVKGLHISISERFLACFSVTATNACGKKVLWFRQQYWLPLTDVIH